MGQNRSTAVMQRRTEAHDSLDDFPTPAWATRALLEFLKASGYPLDLMTAWEPACNRGYMAEPMREYFREVFFSDIEDYGYEGQDAVCDFLMDWQDAVFQADLIMTNPPFRLASEFVLKGLERAPMVAVFVRSAFDEDQERYRALFSKHPEAYALPFIDRVCIWKGILLDPDVKIWNPPKGDKPGKMQKPSSATAYQWLVFKRGHTGPTIKHRIGLHHSEFTRAGDYPPVPEHLREPSGEDQTLI